MNSYPINVLVTKLGDHQLSARADDGFTYSLLCETTSAIRSGAYRARTQEDKLFLEGDPELACSIVERAETTLDQPGYLPKSKK